jgi:hypothetical protein
MNKLLVTLISAITLGATLPAVAGPGPDWHAIEQARKAHQAVQAEHTGDLYEASAPTSAGPQKCAMPDPLVLPLDHGPRAQTTPYLNHQRKERYMALVQACKEASK